MSDGIMIHIITQIYPPDVNHGFKSTQAIEIDFEKQEVNSAYATGTTEVVMKVRLPSIQDDFKVSNVKFDAENTVTFKASGHTETMLTLTVLPGIDYEMWFMLRRDGTGHVFGKHDGYPGYSVKVARGHHIVRPYFFRHKPHDLWKLKPPMEINFPKKRIMV